MRIQCFASRVLFIANFVIFLLIIILSYVMFLVLFTRHFYSALDCAISMSRCLIRYISNNLGRASIQCRNFQLKVAGRGGEAKT